MNRPAHPDLVQAMERSVPMALLDQAGVVVEVNEAWSTFTPNNGDGPILPGVGASFLTAIEAAAAEQVMAAIRATTDGKSPAAVTVPLVDDVPEHLRLFKVGIAARFGPDGAGLGATVTLTRTTSDGSGSGDGQHSGESEVNDDPPELSFPDLPRLQLEEAIGQLTSHARDVLHAQERLRALLRANRAIASDLSLPVVLRQIVTAARHLVGARYAALGVIGHDGTLEQFVHVGIDQQLVDRIGRLPTGRGILGELINHPQQPLRLADLRNHPASTGFPEHHPSMTSFLGVPIQVGDRMFGNLYLADCARGEFSADDEQLVSALATAAGGAIENARLFQEASQHRKWLAASTEVTQQLFAGTTDHGLDLVLTLAAQGADADLANLVLPVADDPARGWSVHSAVGLLADQVPGTPLDADSLAWQVIESGKGLLLDDYSQQIGETGIYNRLAAAAVIGSVICVPLLADEQVIGVLSVGRVTGRERFSQLDLQQLAGFAGHAGLALKLDGDRASRETLARVQDHDRIAADLHEHVIRELFATGIGLEGMAGLLGRPDDQRRLLGYVDAIDSTIRRIRATIFELQSDPGNRPGSTEDEAAPEGH